MENGVLHFETKEKCNIRHMGSGVEINIIRKERHAKTDLLYLLTSSPPYDILFL